MGEAQSFRLIIQPNASLSWSQARVVLALFAITFGIIGLVFSAQGYWLVLPFAGLEFSALAVALWVCVRRNDDREVLTIRKTESGYSEIVVEKGRCGSRPTQCWHVRPSWASLRLVKARDSSTGWLELRGSGQVVELGRCLTDAERVALAKRIQPWLGTGS